MQKFHLKSKLWAMIFCLIASASFNSCDKAKQLEGTTWEGDCDFYSNYYGRHDGTVSIYFTTTDADIRADFKNDGDKVICKGTANYSCDKDQISIRIRWKDDWIDDIDDGRWTGKVEKNTMTLRNVFGETVRFKKR
jgi:hypothetical protein